MPDETTEACKKAFHPTKQKPDQNQFNGLTQWLIVVFYEFNETHVTVLSVAFH